MTKPPFKPGEPQTGHITLRFAGRITPAPRIASASILFDAFRRNVV